MGCQYSYVVMSSFLEGFLCVESISAIHFDLRGRLGGVLAALSTTSPHECVFATRAEEGIKKATGTP